jgi:hypothetical protein
MANKLSPSEILSDAAKEPNIVDIPAIPDDTPSGLKRVLDALREYVQVIAGRRGNDLDTAVTFRDLLNSGIGSIDLTQRFRSGTVPITLSSDVAIDYATPPAPTSLTANGGFETIYLGWSGAGFTSYAYTEIWRSGTNNLSNATMVGTSVPVLYADAVSSNTTYYYWVRFVNKVGLKGAYNATNGTSATSAINTQYVLSTLTNQITESQLYSSLATRISLIDAPNTTAGSVNARVQSLSDSTTQSINSLQSQVSSLQNVAPYSATTTYAVNDQVTYSGSLYKAKSTTTGNLPTNTTYWTLIGNYTSLGDAVAAHTTQITTLGSNLGTEIDARTTLYNQVNNATTGLPATYSALTNNYYTKSETSGAISSQLTNYVTNTTLANYTSTSLLQDGYYSKTGTENAITSRLTNYVSTTALNTALGSYTTTANLSTNYATKSDVTQARSDLTSTLTSAYQAADTAAINSANAYTQTYAYAKNETYTKSTIDSAISSASTTLTSSFNAADAIAVANATAAAQSYTQSYAYSKTDSYTRTEAESAIASQVNTVSARLNNGGDVYTSIQNEATARANADGSLQAQYTVKIDNNGHISGFGLASTTTNATPSSAFIVRADKFAIAGPTDLSNGLGTTSPTTNLPFIVTTSTTYAPNGDAITPGVYIDTAYVKKGSIETAQIKDLTANKITSGYTSAAIGFNGAKVYGAELYSGGSVNTSFDGNGQIVGFTPVNPTFKVANGGVDIRADYFRIFNSANNYVTPFMVVNNTTYIDSAVIQDGSITNAKISDLNAGKINAGTIAAQYIDSRGLTIKAADGTLILGAGVRPGNSSNIIPDSTYLDPLWWTFGNVPVWSYIGAYVNNNGDAANSQPRDYIKFTASTQDLFSRQISVIPGETYSLKIKVYRSADFAGRFWAGVHLTQDIWWTTAPYNSYSNPEAGISFPAETWLTYEGTRTIYTLTNWLQTRINYSITAGYVELHMELRKVTDASLIADNAVTANKINVGSLSAVSANMGGLTSGYINLSGDGNGWGYARSYNKWWADGANGWILAREGSTGNTFVNFVAGNSEFRMSSWQDNLLAWRDSSGNEKLYIDASGNARFSGTLTAGAVNAVRTINVANNAIAATSFTETVGLSGYYVELPNEYGAGWVQVNYPSYSNTPDQYGNPSGARRTLHTVSIQVSVPNRDATNVKCKIQYSTQPWNDAWVDINTRINTAGGGSTSTQVFMFNDENGYGETVWFRVVVGNYYYYGRGYYPQSILHLVQATWR